jgi:plastocyanin
MRMSMVIGLAVAIASGLGATSALAAAAGVTLTLKAHRFTPSEFSIPPGQKVRVTLVNQDPATEEFDSVDLGIEADVTPMGRTSFDIGPLQPGQYSFMGELHADTAQGKVVVEPAR